MATILITGGTGLVGTALTEKLLAAGEEVIILSRSKQPSKTEGLHFAQWNIEDQTIDTDALMRADYIIHLAGAGVADKRWTAKRKREIVDSRVHSSRLLANSLLGLKHKVKAVISASAIGWYGPDKGGEPFKETDPPATDFLGETCRLWEESVDRIAEAGPRIVKLRTGIVLSRKGGALKEFLKPMKWGVAPVMGSGKQVMSWIYIDDLVNLYLFALRTEKMNGSYNALATEPVSNRQFIVALTKAGKKSKIRVRVPSFILKIMLGEMSVEVLKSCAASSKKSIDAGFSYQYPNIEIATRKIFG